MTNTNRLKQLVADYSNTYKSLCETSRKEYMHSLPPGSAIPKPGKLYTNAAKQQFADKCSSLRSEAAAIIQDDYADISNKFTEPPEPGAFDAVNMLKMRNDVTADEIDMMLTRYKGNVQTYKAIRNTATEKGLHGFKDHPIQARYDKLKMIDSRLQKTFTPFEADRGCADEWRISVLNDEIDALND